VHLFKQVFPVFFVEKEKEKEKDRSLRRRPDAAELGSGLIILDIAT